jgi:hypothetical protein
VRAVLPDRDHPLIEQFLQLRDGEHPASAGGSFPRMATLDPTYPWMCWQNSVLIDSNVLSTVALSVAV